MGECSKAKLPSSYQASKPGRRQSLDGVPKSCGPHTSLASSHSSPHTSRVGPLATFHQSQKPTPPPPTSPTPPLLIFCHGVIWTLLIGHQQCSCSTLSPSRFPSPLNDPEAQCLLRSTGHYQLSVWALRIHTVLNAPDPARMRILVLGSFMLILDGPEP